jgi:transposase-like protein
MTFNLKQIYKQLPSQEDCLNFLEKALWDNKPVCPYCTTGTITPLKGEKRYHCNQCNSSFSVTVRTIFHRNRCDLQKWFYALYLLNQGPMTARELGEKIEVTKDTAWKMMLKSKLWFRDFPDKNQKIISALTNKK